MGLNRRYSGRIVYVLSGIGFGEGGKSVVDPILSSVGTFCHVKGSLVSLSWILIFPGTVIVSGGLLGGFEPGGVDAVGSEIFIWVISDDNSSISHLTRLVSIAALLRY